MCVLVHGSVAPGIQMIVLLRIFCTVFAAFPDAFVESSTQICNIVGFSLWIWLYRGRLLTEDRIYYFQYQVDIIFETEYGRHVRGRGVGSIEHEEVRKPGHRCRLIVALELGSPFLGQGDTLSARNVQVSQVGLVASCKYLIVSDGLLFTKSPDAPQHQHRSARPTASILPSRHTRLTRHESNQNWRR